MSEPNNIIIFPTLRDSLEEIENQAYESIQKQDYEIALQHVNYLLSHQYCSYDIHVSKLICHIKLNDLAEAEKFCENLVIDSDEPHYFDYLEYYVMILYEREKYAYLIELIENEEKNEKMPEESQKRLREIYRLAYQMNVIRSDELIQELRRSVKEENHQKQWYILNKWKELKTDPPELLFTLLKNNGIHPAIKTLVLESLKDLNIRASIEVEKFKDTSTILLDALPLVMEHPTYKYIVELLQETEQENPTLFLLIKDLLYQFNYIQYPHMYTDKELKDIAKAFVLAARDNLSLNIPKGEVDNKIQEYINQIHLCNELYLNICLH